MKRIVYVFLVIGLVLIGILIFKSMDNRLIYMDLPQDKIFDLVPTKYGKLDFQKLSEFQIDFTDNPGYLPSYKRYLYSSEEKLDLLGTNIDHLYIPFEMTGNRRMGDYPLFLTNDGSIVNKNIVNYSFVSYGEERNLAPVKTEVRSMFIAIRFAQYIDGEYMPSTGIQTTSIVKELPAGIGICPVAGRLIEMLCRLLCHWKRRVLRSRQRSFARRIHPCFFITCKPTQRACRK